MSKSENQADARELERRAVDRALRERRTPPHFKGQPVPKALLLEALELARFAQNHKLTNPWRFHLLGKRSIERVAALNARLVREKFGEEAARKKLERWLSMPGWLVITCKSSPDDTLRHQEDYAACCCAVQNLALALWARGVGLKWSTGDVTRHEEFHELLGVDPHEEYAIGLFWYGYPEGAAESSRVPLKDVLRELP
jgi:nitroreductase